MAIGNKQVQYKVKMLLDKDILFAIRQGINEFTESVQEEAFDETPVDTGVLRANTRKTLAETSHHKTKATLYNNTAYALDQHENLEYSHRNGGKAKYLSATAYSLSGELIADVRGNILSAIRRRGV